MPQPTGTASTPQDEAGGSRPSADEIRGQLRRMLGSRDFAASDRRKRFLEFVVEAELNGDADQLKGYTIATEVFGRGDDFDPGTDPIVRLEAGRLRRDLELYYLKSGAHDPVRISIPKGGNAPRFDAGREARPSSLPEPDSTTPGTDAAGASRSLEWLAALAAAIVAAGLLSAWWLASREPVDGKAKEIAQLRVDGRPGVGVIVLPFTYSADTERHPFLDVGLVEELIAALSTLQRVEVVASGSAARIAEAELSPAQIASQLAIDYLIRGAVRQEGTRVRITVSVIEPDSHVRLSRTYDGTLESVLDLQIDLARDVAEALAKAMDPRFEGRLGLEAGLDPDVLDLYYRAAALRDPPSDTVRSRLAEQAYRRVIELAPDFPGGHAGLAYVLAFRSWWGVGDQPDAEAAEALRSARRAVELDPSDGWAQMSLGVALMAGHEHEPAAASARRAVELAPSDPHVLAFSAMVRAFSGEVAAAIPLALSAVRVDPLSARRPYRNVSGVLLFHGGRFDEALAMFDENRRIGGPYGPHISYYRAGALARLGRFEEARREIERAQSPPFDFDIRDFLAGFRDPSEGKKLLDSLDEIAAAATEAPTERDPTGQG